MTSTTAHIEELVSKFDTLPIEDQKSLSDYFSYLLERRSVHTYVEKNGITFSDEWKPKDIQQYKTAISLLESYRGQTMSATIKKQLEEIAIDLYAKQLVSLEKAAFLANVNRMEFQKTLGNYDLKINYTSEMIQEDSDTFRWFNAQKS